MGVPIGSDCVQTMVRLNDLLGKNDIARAGFWVAAARDTDADKGSRATLHKAECSRLGSMPIPGGNLYTDVFLIDTTLFDSGASGW